MRENRTDPLKEVLWLLGEKACEVHGCRLVEIELHRSQGRWLVRFYIDKDTNITVDECAEVSQTLDRYLEARDPIDTPYTLEVSSPGIDRPLRKEEDFKEYVGKNIRVSVFSPIDGRKNFSGRLMDVADGIISVQVETDMCVRIALDDVKKARLKSN
ncbi:MAG: ribosome maturation factor RimP [Deltaproteobacteria bacterium]|nr:ribosome maturation factor RimP [Candidatus Zymogenaceae bacterium]